MKHAGNFVEWTREQVDRFQSKKEWALVVSPGFKINLPWVMDNGKKDLAVWIDSYMNDTSFQPFAAIILSRVFEHLPIRELDWYIYSMFRCMKRYGELIITVPDMDDAKAKLDAELALPHPDHFLIFKFGLCLFNDGKEVGDYHKIWTNEKSMRYFLEREKLFVVEKMDRITVDSPYDVHLEITARRL